MRSASIYIGSSFSCDIVVDNVLIIIEMYKYSSTAFEEKSMVFVFLRIQKCRFITIRSFQRYDLNSRTRSEDAVGWRTYYIYCEDVLGGVISG